MYVRTGDMIHIPTNDFTQETQHCANKRKTEEVCYQVKMDVNNAGFKMLTEWHTM